MGTHPVTLTVTDNEGAPDSATVNIIVDPVPNQSPTAVATNTTPKTGKAPLSVSFSSAGSGDTDGTITYSWSFSDGGSSTVGEPDPRLRQPRHLHRDVDRHRRRRRARTRRRSTNIVVVSNQAPTAAAGATPLTVKEDKVVTFSSAGSGDSDGTIASYGWTFGDSGTSTAQNPTHIYANPGSYTATLTVTDNNGATGTATVVVTVLANQAPTAVANATPQTVREDKPVAFSSSASVDSDGTITSYSWAFGDGGTSTSANPSHTYANPGSYTATLTVTDDDGATHSASVVVTVTLNNAPTAGINASPASGPAPLNVSFSSTSTDDGTIVSYAWTFGDGGTSTSANPSHTYAAGSYTASLTVTDDGGKTGTTTVGITAATPPAVFDAPTSPVVMTGADLPALVGTAPSNIVAFKFNQVSGSPVWTQVPVQVDQRKVVPFGYVPERQRLHRDDGHGLWRGQRRGQPCPSRRPRPRCSTRMPTPGSGPTRTPTSMPMTSWCSWRSTRAARSRAPTRVSPRAWWPAAVVAVQVQETRVDGGPGWVYLFRSTTLNPAAGQNYVTYNFALTSGQRTRPRTSVGGSRDRPGTRRRRRS